MDTLVLRNLSYGLFIIGAKDGSRLTGCTVNSVGQVTSDPALISVCVNHDNFTNKCIKEAGGFAVSILSEECEGGVIGGFGFRSGKDSDKWDGVPCEKSAGGYPVLQFGTCGYLELKVESSLELPTHTLFVGRLVDGKTAPGAPMTYAYYHKVIKGKTPPKAPSYEPPKTGLWTCPLCGYQYDGAQGPFENLPADWKCPVCGAPKAGFERR